MGNVRAKQTADAHPVGAAGAPMLGERGATGPGPVDVTPLAAPTVVGQVRTLVELRAAPWGFRSRASDVYLIASELITNAVRHTPDERVRVRFTRERGGVLLAVWDASDTMPLLRPVLELSPEDIEPDAEALDPGHDDGTGGWGLPLVAALSERYGTEHTAPHGKWVWALIAC